MWLGFSGTRLICLGLSGTHLNKGEISLRHSETLLDLIKLA